MFGFSGVNEVTDEYLPEIVTETRWATILVIRVTGVAVFVFVFLVLCIDHTTMSIYWIVNLVHVFP